MIKELFIRYKSVIAYGFFGVCTTLVNIISYWVCAHIMMLSTVTGTVIAWVFAVAFAFATNKVWVFGSISWDKKIVIRECVSFFLCRAAIGAMDLIIMFVSVDILGWNDIVIKTLSNILVIILNYIVSKLIIFKNEAAHIMFLKFYKRCRICCFNLIYMPIKRSIK